MPTIEKIHLAVVAGGDSGEYEVSIRSAAVVMKHLDAEKYDTVLIHIRGSQWTYRNEQSVGCNIDKDDFSAVINRKKIRFDCVFIVIHGTPGEDGKLQGYFDMLGIPYTTCGSITSALTFNKSYCKGVVKSLGVKTSASVHLFKERPYDINYILKVTGLPCFVKPNCGGSSVGMTKVKEETKLETAIQTAFAEDREVLVEAFFKGREITCGVFSHKGKVEALPILEVVSKKEFFDFEAKYNPVLADELLPAPIPSDMWKKCQETSINLYSQLGCAGVVRFDYLFNEDTLNFLEVNTVPGLSEESIVPKMALYAGYTLTEFYNILIQGAISGYENDQVSKTSTC